MKSLYLLGTLLYSLTSLSAGQNVIVDLVNGNAGRPSSSVANAPSSSPVVASVPSSSPASVPSPAAANIPSSSPAVISPSSAPSIPSSSPAAISSSSSSPSSIQSSSSVSVSPSSSLSAPSSSPAVSSPSPAAAQVPQSSSPVAAPQQTVIVSQSTLNLSDPNNPQSSTSIIVLGPPKNNGPTPEAGTITPLTVQNDLVQKFCQGLQLNDGTQIKTGSCSATIQGAIPSIDKMPSTLILSPKNGATLKAGSNIAVKVKTRNLELGLFLNPQTDYYTRPQTLNSKGVIQGHQHVVVQKIDFDSQTPPDAQKFEFFKGLDQKPESGNILTTTIEKGLKKGEYRMCTITGSASHQPVIIPAAQRGAQDDCIRFTVK